MDTGMPRQRRIEFSRQRRVGCFEQDFRIAAREHRSNVAGAGGGQVARGIAVRLDRDRGWRKAGALQRPARCFGVAHEVGDMVEKYFIAGRELAHHFA